MRRSSRALQTRIWAGIVTFFAVFSIASIVIQSIKKNGGKDLEIRSDTVYVVNRDTIFIESPKPISMEKIRFVQVPIKDTVVFHDTIYIKLEIDQKVYEDSLYKAWVSGYEVNLDSIEIYRKEITRNITTTITKKYRWGAGIQVGYGAGNMSLSPYIGIGIQYNLVNW